MRFAEKLWEEFVFLKFCQASIFLSAYYMAGSYETKAPRESWHHNREPPVSFMAIGGFTCRACL